MRVSRFSKRGALQHCRLTMQLPTYDELMLPLLQLTAQSSEEQPIRDLREQLAQQLNLTPEQRALKLPSGRQAAFDNRFGWVAS